MVSKSDAGRTTFARAQELASSVRKRRSLKPPLTEHYDTAMVLCARDGVVEQPAQMFWTAGDRVGPEHDDVRKLPVLGALNCHSEMASALREADAGLIANGFTDKFSDLHGGKCRLSLHPTQTLHAADRLRYGGMSCQRPQEHSKIGGGGHLGQFDAG